VFIELSFEVVGKGVTVAFSRPSRR